MPSSFPGASWLLGTNESKWSLDYDCHSLPTLQGGHVTHAQSASWQEWGEVQRVFQRAPGILSNSFSLLSSLPSAAEGPTLPPNVGDIPLL